MNPHLKSGLSVTLKADDPSTAEVMIYDNIGENWWGDGISALQFVKDLAALGPLKTLSVRINSGGGDVVDGLAIYNAIVRCGAKVTVSIDGLAGSIASVIAMAGTDRTMAENAMLMIHDPMSICMGTSTDMREVAAIMDKWGDSIVAIYQKTSGQNEEWIRAAMSAGKSNSGTWYSAAEAKAAGFVTEVTPNKQIAASLGGLAKIVNHVPEWVRQRINACSQAKGPVMADSGKTQTNNPATPAPVAQAVDLAAAQKQARDDGRTAGLEEGRKQERERITKITALCQQAKRPDLAAKFCEDPALSVADVQEKLFEVLCQANIPVGETNNPAPSKPKDGLDQYRQEFKENSFLAAKMSEAEYLEIRQVEDGKKPLTTGAK